MILLRGLRLLACPERSLSLCPDPRLGRPHTRWTRTPVAYIDAHREELRQRGLPSSGSWFSIARPTIGLSIEWIKHHASSCSGSGPLIPTFMYRSNAPPATASDNHAYVQPAASPVFAIRLLNQALIRLPQSQRSTITLRGAPRLTAPNPAPRGVPASPPEPFHRLLFLPPLVPHSSDSFPAEIPGPAPVNPPTPSCGLPRTQ
jgi:hypothetical protein